jgi:prepilin-type N-terminal cleavage/methylation domain-containing protein
MNMKSKKSGFTLTEILIVLVIAGILLALILPNSLKAISRGNTVAGDSNVQSCSTAVMVCYADQGRDWTKCDSVSELTTLKYLKSTPKNAAGADVAVISDPNGTGGFICN